MKNLIVWFTKNPVAANLLMLAMLIGGVFGFMNFDREFIPTTDVNGITVTASWPGASPQDIEDQLLSRFEEAVDGLDGIDYLESTAQEGIATLSIITKLGIDYDGLLDRVKGKIDSINNLPPDSFEPQVTRMEFRFDIFYIALHGDLDRQTLQRKANDIRLKIAEVPGLQLTNIMTKAPEQVTIEVSEAQLLKYNLTFNEVANAIAGSSVNLSAGTVETSGGNLQLRARALANTKDEFNTIIIRQTPNGGAIRLGDIANVVDGFDDNNFSAEFQGQNTAIFQILSPDSMNISQAGKDLRAFIEETNQTLPSGLKLTIWLDQSETFSSRMKLIGSNALSGLILVLITLMLFLRPAVAFWVTIGICAAFTGAIAIAPYMGLTLNMISLFSFLLVIGIVVDDAIVVGESIYMHVENGVSGQRGAIAGTNMVVKPVYFAVITTILMFVPFTLLSGPISTLTSQIAFVVITVLIFSLIESFFILPAHLRHLKPLNKDKGQSKLVLLQQRIADSLESLAYKGFRPMVAWLIKFRYWTLSVFTGLLIMSFMLLIKGVTPVSIFPKVDGDMVMARVTFPEGTSFERIEQVRQQVSDGVVKLNANAKKDFGIEGDMLIKAGTFSAGRAVEGYFLLAPTDQRNNADTKAVTDKLEEYVGPVPDSYRATYSNPANAGQARNGIRYGVTSQNKDDLKAALLDLKHEIETYASVTRTYDNLESSAQELRFVLKPGAESLGITLQDVTRQVREAFYGREVQRLPRYGEDVRVMVRYPEADRESIDSLKTLRIRNSLGLEVPLLSVADVEVQEGISRISRRDRKRVNYAGGRVRGEDSEVERIKTDIMENFIPDWKKRHPNATLILLGDDQATATMRSELTASGIIIVLVMYALLAIAFRSYAQPLLIMVALPFAFVGVIFGHIMTDVSFGLMSLFGLFAAGGVAINDNLVLIDYVNRLRERGVGAYQAMLDACVARFRPIFLTSVTTFIGITPILFENSMQAQFLKPMVVALAFGVLFDFFLTLMLVPAMYGVGVDISRMFKGLWTGEKQRPLGSHYDPNVILALDEIELDEANYEEAETPTSLKSKSVPAE